MTITDVRPVIQPAADPWWTCPDWCTNCSAGDAFTHAGRTVITDRIHEGELLGVGTPDGQLVRLLATRYDSPEHAGQAHLVLHVERAYRPLHLDDADIAAQLDGVSRSSRDSLAAHYLAGAFAAQSAKLTAAVVADLIAALSGGVA